MRHKQIQATSTKEERALLEKRLKEYKSLYNLGLELGISESSLYKYRNGWAQGKVIKDKITRALLSPPPLMPR